MKARAIVFPRQDEVEIGWHHLPELRPNEMLVRTEFSGVSQGTEIWAFTGRRPEIKFPTVPGYQAVGIVEAIGREVTQFQVGQRVKFKSCRLPDNYPPTWMGAHASHSVVSEATPVPDGVDPVEAALASLPAVCYRGINMLNIRIGDLVVVTGQGLIGQGSAQLARLRGATVIATDINPMRLELSRKYSSDIAINPKDRDPAQVIRTIKPGGADVVIETTGRSDMFAECINMLRWEGQLLLQGWYPQPITFDFHTIHMKKPTIAVTCGHDIGGIATVLDLMRQDKINFRELITHLVPVSEAPRIYPQMASGSPDILGVVFDWTS